MFFSIILSLLGVFLFSAALVFFMRFQQVRRMSREVYSVVEVRVSRENESGPIVAEQVFATLHGIKNQFSFWEKLQGYSSSCVSFELASVDRVIKYYLAFPEKLRNLVEGQIYAQYPDVEIENCKDYSKIATFGHNAIGAELKFSESDVYPIKRHPQFEDKINQLVIDPMSGITSSLVKFSDPDDQAWIQIVVTPLPGKWRKVFTRCLAILNRGIFSNFESLQKAYARAFTTRNPLNKIIFFPLYFFFWLQGLFAHSGIDSAVSELVDQTSKSHDKETSVSAAMDKVVKPLFEVTIRVVFVPKNFNFEVGEMKLREIVGAFKQFTFPHLNGFEMREILQGQSLVSSYASRLLIKGMVMNNEELATVYHFPNLTVKTPTISWVRSKKLEPPSDLPLASREEELTHLGKTNFRGSNEIFGVRTVDRRRHIYVIGKTGMGKSTLLENMIFSDIMAGRGVGVIDPHGDLADAVLNFVPKSRINDVVLVDPSDRDYAVGFNMLENVDPALNSVICSGLVGIFKKIYAESWGPRLEHILRNTILSLLENEGTTMLGITRLLQDADFRDKIIKKVEDPVVKSFWINEFLKMQDKFRTEAIAPIQNKVGQFLSSPVIRNIVGQPKSTVDLRFAMDTKKIVIINLSKGKIGEDNSALLGAMFITKFQLDAMSRANLPEKERVDFYLYVDEFQNFATDSFATILSEARKYKLNLTMANQYIAQMPDEVRDAVFGNVGTILSFQVGFDDADYLSKQYGEEVLPSDLVSLSKYNAYLRLLVEGMPTKTFSALTLPPPAVDMDSVDVEKVRKVSRERYARPVAAIDDKIKRWSNG